MAIQTTELARHLNPVKVLGVNMGPLSPYPNDWSDYRQSILSVISLDKITPDWLREWLNGIDVLISAETFYHAFVTGVCAEMGVKTVVVANAEFSAHLLADDWAPRPDVLAVPTTWEMDRIPGAMLLPHGINRQRLPYRQRTEAKTFLHVAGHVASMDRAGTRVLFDALQHVTEPMRVVVRSQQGLSITHRPANCVTLEVRDGDLPHYWSLYDDGDVLVSPRRYGGQHLPMMEALSVGMPVLVTDAPPQNGLLPGRMLVRADSWRTLRNTSGEFPLWDMDPRALAAAMDRLVREPGTVAELSAEADLIAERQSWPNLLPVYEALFRSLL